MEDLDLDKDKLGGKERHVSIRACYDTFYGKGVGLGSWTFHWQHCMNRKFRREGV